MITIDWNDVKISEVDRSRAELRIGGLSVGDRDTLALRRRKSGYEAIFTTSFGERATLLRLQGDNIAEVVERTRELLSIVARETSALAQAV